MFAWKKKDCKNANLPLLFILYCEDKAFFKKIENVIQQDKWNVDELLRNAMCYYCLQWCI